MDAASVKPRILYLDDSQTALAEVSNALAELGYEVRVTASVAQAKKLLPSSDMVIVDYHMPEMDGFTALRELRRAEASPHLYFLYTTDPEVATRFRQLGFDGVFTWKGNMDTLASQLQAAARIFNMKRSMGRK
jgi:CheY-like chemotaxis protein